MTGAAGSRALRALTTGSRMSYSTSMSSRASRGRVAVFGHDKGDLLALEAHLVRGEDRLDVVGQRWHPGQAFGGQVSPGDHGLDLGVGNSRAGVDPHDPGVGHRRAQDGEVQHPRQLHVVAVVAQAPDEAGVLLAQHASVADGFLVVVLEAVERPVLHGGHERAPDFLARLVRRCPLDRTDDRCITGAAADLAGYRLADLALGRGRVAVQQGRAVIIMPGVQNPHWSPWHAMKPCWTGSNCPSAPALRQCALRGRRPWRPAPCRT